MKKQITSLLGGLALAGSICANYIDLTGTRWSLESSHEGPGYTYIHKFHKFDGSATLAAWFGDCLLYQIHARITYPDHSQVDWKDWNYKLPSFNMKGAPEGGVVSCLLQGAHPSSTTPDATIDRAAFWNARKGTNNIIGQVHGPFTGWEIDEIQPHPNGGFWILWEMPDLGFGGGNSSYALWRIDGLGNLVLNKFIGQVPGWNPWLQGIEPNGSVIMGWARLNINSSTVDQTNWRVYSTGAIDYGLVVKQDLIIF